MTMTETNDVVRTVIEIEHAALAALGSVAASASGDDSRPLLTAVRLVSTGVELIATATDSYTLARVSIPNTAAAGLDALIPAKWLMTTLRALKPKARGFGSAGKVITLSIDGSTVTLSNGELTLSAQVVEGTYPNVEGIIPAQSNYQVELGAFNGGYLARLADILPDKAAATWMCVSMSATRPAVWTRSALIGTETATALFLLMPVRR